MILGQILREIRQSKGLSLTDLASATGTSKSYLSKVETNKRDPSFNTVSSICLALNVPLSIVILLAEKPEDDEFKEMTQMLQGVAREHLLKPKQVSL